MPVEADTGAVISAVLGFSACVLRTFWAFGFSVCSGFSACFGFSTCFGSACLGFSALAVRFGFAVSSEAAVAPPLAGAWTCSTSF